MPGFEDQKNRLEQAVFYMIWIVFIVTLPIVLIVVISWALTLKSGSQHLLAKSQARPWMLLITQSCSANTSHADSLDRLTSQGQPDVLRAPSFLLRNVVWLPRLLGAVCCSIVQQVTFGTGEQQYQGGIRKHLARLPINKDRCCIYSKTTSRNGLSLTRRLWSSPK